MSDRVATAEALQSRYAKRIAARLTSQAENMAPDIGERLRFARLRALDHARAVRAMRAATQQQTLAAAAGAGALALAGGPRRTWWVGVLSLLPLLALIAGLMLIQSGNTRRQIAAAVEIDTDLLLDDLPPSAYSDPGFVEYLKNERD